MKYSTDRFNNRFKIGRKRTREPKPPRAKRRDRMVENTKKRWIQPVDFTFL